MAILRYKRLEIGEYDIPDDAIYLIQDIATLEIMGTLLDGLQDKSFVGRPDGKDYATRKNEALKVLRRVAWLISLLKGLAEQNLKEDFLGDKPYRSRKAKQNISDIWELICSGLSDQKKSLNDKRSTLSNSKTNQRL